VKKKIVRKEKIDFDTLLMYIIIENLGVFENTLLTLKSMIIT
jgi:hypothetical protein